MPVADIANRVVGVAVIEDPWQALGDEPVVLIEGAGKTQAVAVVQRLDGAKGEILEVADQRLGTTAGFQAQAGELALTVAVVDDLPRGVGLADQLALGIVAIDKAGVDVVLAGAALLDQVAVGVVEVVGGAFGIAHLGEAADAIRTLIVAVGDISAAVGVVHGREAVEGVVGIGGGNASGVGLGKAVTGLIVGVSGYSGVGAGLAD
ncbi:MAG: hypothetical protein P8179_07705 [Candidatus Thiodiazotropha sp.]